jgi:membrane associated rhomboid family serine protease
LDSIARLVRFHSLDFVPDHRTLEQKAGLSSVSSAAHLGGAAVGVLAWLVWRKRNDESRMLE